MLEMIWVAAHYENLPILTHWRLYKLPHYKLEKSTLDLR